MLEWVKVSKMDLKEIGIKVSYEEDERFNFDDNKINGLIKKVIF